MLIEWDKIIDFEKAKFDKNGILLTDSIYKNEILTSKLAWEEIYNYNVDDLKKDRNDFDENKLEDHISYLDEAYNFNKNTIYLEIGCGPAHIGEYIMKMHDAIFIGVDFNYSMLITLKKYLDEKGYKKYLLIHGDINDMPIKDNLIDFVYGGGVIEHFSNTNNIIKESNRILKKGGFLFNTVPALNLWWFLRLFNTIPSLPILRKIFEFIHIKLFKSKILKKYAGYQLAFTKKELVTLYKNNNFQNICVGSFAFHPSRYKLKNRLLRELYFKLQKIDLITAIYYIRGYNYK